MQDILRAAVLDDDKCLNDLEKTPGPVQLTLCPSASAAELLTSVVVDQPDVVLLDATFPDVCGADLQKRLRDISPDIPILMLLSTNPDWFEMEADPFLDFVKGPVEGWQRFVRKWAIYFLESRLIQSLALKNSDLFIPSNFCHYIRRQVAKNSSYGVPSKAFTTGPQELDFAYGHIL